MKLELPQSILNIQNLNAYFGQHQALKGINLGVSRHRILSMIGPSGCGKSTFIRCINRLHEEVSGAWVTGQIQFEGTDIYTKNIDPVAVRRRVGMVFQKPNPFQGLSIFDNVAIGLRLAGISKRSILNEVVEKSLVSAALWEEVKDKLKAPGTSLSGGQQQRLCIARTLAVDPPVILMDEPTSALDPISTAKIEELLLELKKTVTIVIVTHNMQQAARISDETAFFLLGELIECGSTTQMFTNPRERRTEEYITGRFG